MWARRCTAEFVFSCKASLPQGAQASCPSFPQACLTFDVPCFFGPAGFDYTVWPGQVDPVNGLVVDEIRLLIRRAVLTHQLARVLLPTTSRLCGPSDTPSPSPLRSRRPTDKQSIEDFGKPESINFAQAYGMKERGFPRADVLGVNVRKVCFAGRQQHPPRVPAPADALHLLLRLCLAILRSRRLL